MDALVDLEFGAVQWQRIIRCKAKYQPDISNYPYDRQHIIYYIASESSYNIRLLDEYDADVRFQKLMHDLAIKLSHAIKIDKSLTDTQHIPDRIQFATAS